MDSDNIETIPQLKRNKDNKEVNKEPHSMLIDNRFDNVKDWKRLENDSNIPKVNKNNCNVDRKSINNTTKIIKPNE
jgi:hypothetical protein